MRRSIFLLVAVAVTAACSKDSTGPKSTPVINSVAPAQGTAGTEVAISGSSFSAGDVQVFFDDLPSPRAVLEGGTLYALAPEGITEGTTYDVRVVNGDGGEATLTAAYEAVAPTAVRINGVSLPTGLRGMTIIIDGDAFGDSLALSAGKVFFTDGTGSPVEAPVVDTANDWTDKFIVTSVPSAAADTSWVWVQTATGVSDSIQFLITAQGSFSPSAINWTTTTPLPQPLQGLGATFVPVESGQSPANYVFAVAGADTQNVATDVAFRATVAQTGALGAWTELPPLPAPRAYQATAAATAYTAALDTTTTGAYLYALGGVDSTGATVNTVYYAQVDLNGDVGSWAETTPLPQPLHSSGVVLFRGYLYLVGGADSTHTAVPDVYRIPVNTDGTLGASWEQLASLPAPSAYGSLVSFGPYLYAIGGDSATVLPVTAAQSGTETSAVYLARINLRTGSLTDAGWSATAAMGKTRSKHSAIFSGGSLLVTSGLYAGNAGSSENTFAQLLNDGTLNPWQGATGAETIATELGYSLYNQAAITFIDSNGIGHVLVLGGARTDMEGTPSASVVYY
ncbi:MAG: kelch repeat-containing protein [Gemmatimonadota bacterium]